MGGVESSHKTMFQGKISLRGLQQPNKSAVLISGVNDTRELSSGEIAKARKCL